VSATLQLLIILIAVILPLQVTGNIIKLRENSMKFKISKEDKSINEELNILYLINQLEVIYSTSSSALFLFQSIKAGH